MSATAYSLVAFIVAIGILVTVHEFGHFWVARQLGVKILRFSIGFGKPLWQRLFGHDRTEFTIGSIPLGGYVKMLDEREGEVPVGELPRAFNQKPLLSRTAIVVAGPGFNFIFAIAAYALLYSIGIPGIKPIVGQVLPDSIAAHIGFKPQQEIVAVDSQPTPTWEAVIHAWLPTLLQSGATTTITVRENGWDRDIQFTNTLEKNDFSQRNILKELGLQPLRPSIPAVIGEVLPEGAAARAHLQAGDQIIAVDDQPVNSWEEWAKYIQTHPGNTLKLDIQRDGKRIALDLVPERVTVNNEVQGKIGAAARLPVEVNRELLATEQYPVFDAIKMAIIKTRDLSVMTLKVLGQMLIGKASIENLSGPISIAQYAGQSARMGLVPFLEFLALVSISLAVLNLLPVPLLDGGHLVYYLFEAVLRRPLSPAVTLMAQQVGILFLLAVMGLALYNDIVRLLQH